MLYEIKKQKDLLHNHTNLESRLEVDYELRLDEPNEGKKKSILETLHTKSEQEQAKEMIEYWKKQMEKVNKFSHRERTHKIGEFHVKYSSSCKLIDPPIKKEKETLEVILGKPLDTPDDLNPLELSIRDCVEGENDARKWFASTMHLYIKFLVDQDLIQNAIQQQNQKSFLGSLYDVYLSQDKNDSIQNNDKKRLQMIKEECFDLFNIDVYDQYSEEIFEKGRDLYFFYLF